MKKFLAILLTAVMLVGVFGVASFAAEPTALQGTLAIEGPTPDNPTNDHFGDGRLSVVYYPVAVTDDSTAALEAMNAATLSAKITVVGGTQGTQTVTVTDFKHAGPFGTNYAWRFSASDIKLSAGCLYTITTELVNASGKTVYVLGAQRIASTYTTAGQTAATAEMTKDYTTEGLTNLTEKLDTSKIKIINTATGSHPNFYQQNTEQYWIDGAEGVLKLFDGTISADNKLCSEDNELTITWGYTEAVAITDYVMHTGGDTKDAPSRNPVQWTLSGSNDGNTWTVVDSVAYGGLGAENVAAYGKSVKTPGAYTTYKLELISSNKFQLSELVTFNNPTWKPAQPETPDKPAVTTQKPATSEKPAVTTQKPTTTGGSSEGKNPGTGDATALIAAFAVIAVVAGAAVVISKKRAM